MVLEKIVEQTSRPTLEVEIAPTELVSVEEGNSSPIAQTMRTDSVELPVIKDVDIPEVEHKESNCRIS